MASNRKIKERKAKSQAKADGKFVKLLTDVDKVLSTGELPSHGIPGGQPFTRGMSIAARMKAIGADND